MWLLPTYSAQNLPCSPLGELSKKYVSSCLKQNSAGQETGGSPESGRLGRGHRCPFRTPVARGRSDCDDENEISVALPASPLPPPPGVYSLSNTTFHGEGEQMCSLYFADLCSFVCTVKTLRNGFSLLTAHPKSILNLKGNNN